jgi:hypothetical protein
VLHPGIAQQLRESYPQLIGYRVLRSIGWSLPIGTTRWLSSSMADAFAHFLRLYVKCQECQKPSEHTFGTPAVLGI